MKALVGAFNQEKALVGPRPVIVKTGCGTDGVLHSTSCEACATGYCFHMGQSLLAACLWQKLSFLVLQLISGCVDTNMIIMWRSISLVLLFFISSSNAGKSLNYMSSSV